MQRAFVLSTALLIAPLIAQATTLQPFAGSGSAPAAPWQVIGLPAQSKPFTHFSVVELDGQHALRVEADSSYGNLVHPLHLSQPPLTRHIKALESYLGVPRSMLSSVVAFSRRSRFMTRLPSNVLVGDHVAFIRSDENIALDPEEFDAI